MSKKLYEFLNEDDDSELPATDQRDRLISFIVQNFYRFANNPSMKDNQALLLLVAALSTVSASDSPTALQGARRLVQAAMSRAGKTKKEPS